MDLLADACLGQFFDQLGLRGTGPGPRTDVAQTFFVNVNNYKTAFVFVFCGQAPGQVGRAFVNARQPSWGDPLQGTPDEQGQQEPEGSLAPNESAPWLDQCQSSPPKGDAAHLTLWQVAREKVTRLTAIGAE